MVMQMLRGPLVRGRRRGLGDIDCDIFRNSDGDNVSIGGGAEAHC